MAVIRATGQIIRSSTNISYIRDVEISELATWKREYQNEISCSIHTSHCKSKGRRSMKCNKCQVLFVRHNTKLHDTQYFPWRRAQQKSIFHRTNDKSIGRPKASCGKRSIYRWISRFQNYHLESFTLKRKNVLIVHNSKYDVPRHLLSYSAVNVHVSRQVALPSTFPRTRCNWRGVENYIISSLYDRDMKTLIPWKYILAYIPNFEKWK
jgi:hypothetical protein